MLYPNIICRDSILREGYPLDLMYPIELTRHQRVLDLYFARKTRTSGPVEDLKQGDRIIVVSLTADESNSLLMLSATITACRNLKNLKISVKPHPAWSFNLDKFETTHPASEGKRIHVVNNNEDIFGILQSADLLVTSGTQMAFEGMLLDVMPIIYEPNYRFNPTNFESFSDICFVTDSSIELEELIHSVLDNDAISAAKKKSWPNFLNAFFGLGDDYSQKSLYSALIKINSSN
jgi:CDP-glycerol glycerophosphotransferase (TagB/SpsB family)